MKPWPKERRRRGGEGGRWQMGGEKSSRGSRSQPVGSFRKGASSSFQSGERKPPLALFTIEPKWDQKERWRRTAPSTKRVGVGCLFGMMEDWHQNQAEEEAHGRGRPPPFTFS